MEDADSLVLPEILLSTVTYREGWNVIIFIASK